MPPAMPRDLCQVLRARARHQPEQIAYTFLRDGESEERSITHAQLDVRARAIAAVLRSRCQSGDRAILLYPSGLDFIEGLFGCLYAGVIAVAVPAQGSRQLVGLRAVVADCDAKLILTTSYAPGHEAAGGVAALLETDTIADLAPSDAQADEGSEPIAILQYTSGTTQSRRGVMVTHENILANQWAIQQRFGHGPHTVVVSWLPFYHDMGLTGNVFQPLFVGARSIFFSPNQFLDRPIRWLAAISRYRGTTSGGPNFAYDLCARRAGMDEGHSLDLSCWRVAFNGAEPIRRETLDRFRTTFAGAGFQASSFLPCYGLAEATLMVSSGVAGDGARTLLVSAKQLAHGSIVSPTADERTASLVSCGAPFQSRVAIVDAHRRKLAEGQVGEVWVAGPSVARGYFNRREDTEQTFRAQLVSEETHFLRTGDLGFLLHDELYLTGRLKDLIIVRGVNHLPQDIEETVRASHPSTEARGSAAFSVDVGSSEALVVVQEVDRELAGTLGEVTDNIRRRVSRVHELGVHDVVLVAPAAIPRTSSGKVQRQRCRELYLDGKLVRLDVRRRSHERAERDVGLARAVPSSSALEQELLAMVAQLLKVPGSSLGTQRPTAEVGIDSLTSLELRHAIERRWRVQLPLRLMARGPTIAELAQAVSSGDCVAASGVDEDLDRSVASDLATPLSEGQRTLWIQCQASPQPGLYHLTRAIRIRGDLDVNALQRAFQELLDRHPLMTAHVVPGDEPLLRSAPMAVSVGHVPASGTSVDEITVFLERFAREPLDLTRGPAVRASVLALDGSEFVLAITVHHLIFDLWSLGIVLPELWRRYRAALLGHPDLLRKPCAAFSDHVRAERLALQGEGLERLRSFWSEALRDCSDELRLPIDRPRPAMPQHRGAREAFVVSAALKSALGRLAERHRVTLHTILLAAYEILLHRYSEQPAFMVGIVSSGRGVRFVDVVGYFVNVLPVPVNLTDDPRVSAFLERTQECVVRAIEHEALPLSRIIEELSLRRPAGGPAALQAVLVYQEASRSADLDLNRLALNVSGSLGVIDDLALEVVTVEERFSVFDLALIAGEVDGGIAGRLEYDADLLTPRTVENLIASFLRLLESLAAGIDRRVSELPVNGPAEERLLLEEWNATSRSLPNEPLLHALIRRPVEVSPNAVAVVWRDHHLTYEALNERGNQLADLLRSSGVGPEVRVGLCVRPFLTMAIGILGVLKAGGAYVPLDPGYPPERLNRMLRSVSLVVTDQPLPVEPPGVGVVMLDEECDLISQRRREDLPATAAAANLACLLYTSGSTGQPKGVMLTHEGLANHCLAAAQHYELTPADVVAQVSSISFDNSIEELFATWLRGGRVVLREHAVPASASEFLSLIRREQLTVLDLPTSYWREIVVGLAGGGETVPPSVRLTKVGGDRLSSEALRSWRTRTDAHQRFVNGYGPTEVSVGVTFHELPPGMSDLPENIPIGRPHNNRKLYVLDARLGLAPLGAIGEVFVGGIGVARGYLDDQALTSERFLPDPHCGEPGLRMYRTGDRARLLHDGSVEFHGRLDHQLKIGGYRIEPAEVEAVFERHPGVVECAAFGVPGSNRETRLKLLAVISPGAPITASELRAFGRRSLPPYMLPAITLLERPLPRTATGKISYGALESIDTQESRDVPARVAPSDALEQSISGVWSEVLQVREPAIDESFFDLGGSSLLLLRAHARLQAALGRELSMVHLFEFPTIRTLAQFLRDGARGARSSAQPVEARSPTMTTPQHRSWRKRAQENP